MRKLLGISLLLVAVCLVTGFFEPNFYNAINLENLIRRTSLFGIISVGAAFVIITRGIDLSIGSVIGLTGCMMPLLLLKYGWPWPLMLMFTFGASLLIGLAHGVLITKIRLQPFVVTLCGLLIYRGVGRWITDDRTMGFGAEYDESLRLIATYKLPGPWPAPGLWRSFAACVVLALLASAILFAVRWLIVRGGGQSSRWWLSYRFAIALCFAPCVLGAAIPTMWTRFDYPISFFILLGLAGGSAFFLQRTVWGRQIFAIGSNPEAARYCGIHVGRVTTLTYIICSGMAGIAGILFALDVGSVQPAQHGNFYELYAIAAAVLGGCSLRGGEGSILGVVIGAAVMRVLYNSINLLGIPTQLEFAIIGAVILIGVVADETIRRYLRGRAAPGIVKQGTT